MSWVFLLRAASAVCARIAVVTQSSTRQPHGEDRVLAEVLLELSAQIDSSGAGLLGSVRMDLVRRGRLSFAAGVAWSS